MSCRVYVSRACAERLRSCALAAKERPEWSRSERKQLRPRRPLEAARGQYNGTFHHLNVLSSCEHIFQPSANGPRRRAVAAKERLDRPRHSFKPVRLNLSHIPRDPICTQTRVCDCEQYSQSHKLTRSVRIGFHLVTLTSGVPAALPPHGLPLAAARPALEDVHRRTGDEDAPPRTRTFGVAAAHDDGRSRWRRRAAQCSCVGRVSRKASSILQHPPRTPPPGGASGAKFRQTIVV